MPAKPHPRKPTKSARVVAAFLKVRKGKSGKSVMQLAAEFDDDWMNGGEQRIEDIIRRALRAALKGGK